MYCGSSKNKTKENRPYKYGMYKHTKNLFSSVIDILDTFIQMLTQTYKSPTKRLSTIDIHHAQDKYNIYMHAHHCDSMHMHVYAKAGAGSSPAGVSWVSNQLPCCVLPVAVSAHVGPHCSTPALGSIFQSAVKGKHIHFQTQRRCGLKTSH